MASNQPHHVFLSYARKDNEVAGGEGWITAFEREIRERHQKYSGRELNIFFDRKAIDIGSDWRRRLGEGIRTSRLFLAFLSPNYIASENCLWEWDEYLRREHSTARGDDGITPIFFVTPDSLVASHDPKLAAWLADLGRRNRTSDCELQPWFDKGPEVLKQMDAALRSAEVKAGGRNPGADLRTLAERLDSLDRRIAVRLDRIALADLAPGNIARSHEHFVGRHRELSALHTIMLTGGESRGGHGSGGRGMIAAAHSPGGLGKTALARQYAHAYAEFYAAGGTWEVGCEGASHLGAVLLRLADDARFLRIGAEVGYPLVLSEAQRENYALATRAVLDNLRAVTAARVALLREQLRRHPDRHSVEADLPEIEQPRALILLDNVDQPALLDAAQIALLPAEEWLEVIVTTRLDPGSFGGGDRVFRHVEVDVLPEADTLHLLADFQPDHRFADAAEETAAREIARLLGGYTLAVELVAAYLGDLARQGYRAEEFLEKLRGAGGFALVDELAAKPAVDKALRHGEEREERDRIQQNQIATLVRWSLERLSEPARAVLEFSCLLMPDEIPLAWLHDLAVERFPQIATAELDDPYCWPALWRELHGLRLLHPAREIVVDDRGLARLPEVVRIHRLVAGHVAEQTADGKASFAAIDRYLDAMTTRFEQDDGPEADAWRHHEHPWLRNHMEHLIAPPGNVPSHPPTLSILSAALVTASFEGAHGSLVRALDFTRRILSVQWVLLAEDPRSAQAARDVSVSLMKLGDFCLQRGQPGDAEQALRAFQQSLELTQELRDDDPHSALAARDVSMSLLRLGNFYRKRSQTGDAEKALRAFQQCHEARQEICADNPESAQAARDVSVSLMNLGDLYLQRGQPGDVEQARRAFQQCHEALEKLWTDNPHSAQAARDVSVSLMNLGKFYRQRGQPGDTEQALQAFQQSLDVAQKLWDDNLRSAQAARDVSVSLNELGEFYVQRGQGGDAEQALQAFQQSLDVAQKLWDDNPRSAQAARDVSVSLIKLGDFYLRRGQSGDTEHAFRALQQSLDVTQKLWDDNPQLAQAARDVLVSLERLAIVHAFANDHLAALDAQERSSEIARRLFQRAGSWELGRTLVISLLRTGEMAGRAGDSAKADLLLRESYTLLHSSHEGGTDLGHQMQGLHDQLQGLFANG